ncbi:MAG: ATP phosphoribosyltransferase regulatory subunit [Beijerinckiaceae bacterium]
MSASYPEAQSAVTNALATILLAHFSDAGYLRCDPPILQPSSVFLDLSGEEIRHRLYLASDASGGEHCLRPEFTIPVSRAYLASADAGRPVGYSYCGPIFRYRPNASGEYIQAGLESFGCKDRAAADAEILSLAIEAAAEAGHGSLAVKIGDAGVFAALLAGLDLPPAWSRRIARGHAKGLSLDAILGAPANGGSSDHSGVLAALTGADKRGARALVEDVLSIAGISSVGGRTAAEIAERFLEQATARSGEGIPAEARALLERYLAISGNPDEASAELRRLGEDAKINPKINPKIDFTQTFDEFDARLGFIAARGIDLSSVTFSAEFARNLDYYTGFVFEARHAGRSGDHPVIGGGRYDRLLRLLGAPGDIPAVGAAIWLDRLSGPSEAAR